MTIPSQDGNHTVILLECGGGGSQQYLAGATGQLLDKLRSGSSPKAELSLWAGTAAVLLCVWRLI